VISRGQALYRLGSSVDVIQRVLDDGGGRIQIMCEALLDLRAVSDFSNLHKHSVMDT